MHPDSEHSCVHDVEKMSSKGNHAGIEGHLVQTSKSEFSKNYQNSTSSKDEWSF